MNSFENSLNQWQSQRNSIAQGMINGNIALDSARGGMLRAKETIEAGAKEANISDAIQNQMEKMGTDLGIDLSGNAVVPGVATLAQGAINRWAIPAAQARQTRLQPFLRAQRQRQQFQQDQEDFGGGEDGIPMRQMKPGALASENADSTAEAQAPEPMGQKDYDPEEEYDLDIPANQGVPSGGRDPTFREEDEGEDEDEEFDFQFPTDQGVPSFGRDLTQPASDTMTTSDENIFSRNPDVRLPSQTADTLPSITEESDYYNLRGFAGPVRPARLQNPDVDDLGGDLLDQGPDLGQISGGFAPTTDASARFIASFAGPNPPRVQAVPEDTPAEGLTPTSRGVQPQNLFERQDEPLPESKWQPTSEDREDFGGNNDAINGNAIDANVADSRDMNDLTAQASQTADKTSSQLDTTLEDSVGKEETNVAESLGEQAGEETAEIGTSLLSGLSTAASVLGGIAGIAGIGFGAYGIYESIEDAHAAANQPTDPYAKVEGMLASDQSKMDTMNASISSDQFASKLGNVTPSFGSLAVPTIDTTQQLPTGGRF